MRTCRSLIYAILTAGLIAQSLTASSHYAALGAETKGQGDQQLKFNSIDFPGALATPCRRY
jgi:hypothetical protein